MVVNGKATGQPGLSVTWLSRILMDGHHSPVANQPAALAAVPGGHLGDAQNDPSRQAEAQPPRTAAGAVT